MTNYDCGYDDVDGGWDDDRNEDRNNDNNAASGSVYNGPIFDGSQHLGIAEEYRLTAETVLCLRHTIYLPF